MPITYFFQEHQRAQHPQASLFPQPIWTAVFMNELSDELIPIMQLNSAELQNYLALHPLQCSSKEAWFAIAFGHPQISNELLQNLSHQLGIDDKSLCGYAVNSGNRQLFDYLQSVDANKAILINKLREESFYSDILLSNNPYIIQTLLSLADAEGIDYTDAFNGGLGGAFASYIDNNYWDTFAFVIKSYSAQCLSTIFKTECLTDNYLLQSAMSANCSAVINELLQYPFEFSYAEMHDAEYGRAAVYPFVSAKLTELKLRKTQFELENPNGIFTCPNPTEARLLFYVVRNLIRRNQLESRDDILFLLDIPAVKELAHDMREDIRGFGAEYLPNSNELLRLALTIGNEMAASILLNIDAVRTLAEQNNFYADEQNGIIDLRAIAHDRESSMNALNLREEQCLSSAIAQYQPLVEQASVSELMKALSTDLESRYTTKPAQIIIADIVVTLPLQWVEFKKLALSEALETQALTAYYQHKIHTAWRYLQKPNQWIDATAAYVYVSNNHQERWSSFEEYQNLVVMLYLAALDEEITPIDNITQPDRLNHFMIELALIGRAHNWDKSRENFVNGRQVQEEYDDLEGDKPSCFSGVKRRLFQSVIGHPLLKLITKDTINQEIREFVRAYFQSVITKENRQILQQARANYIIDTNEEALVYLKNLDIPQAQLELFIINLGEKYGEQFSKGPQFINQIKNSFLLQNEKDAHALNFDYVNLEQLLAEPVLATAVHQATFFAAQSSSNRVDETQHYEEEKESFHSPR